MSNQKHTPFGMDEGVHKMCEELFANRYLVNSNPVADYRKTDVLLDAENFPFITLTQSKICNLWYHDTLDTLYCFTSRGFTIAVGSKKSLAENGLLRY